MVRATTITCKPCLALFPENNCKFQVQLRNPGFCGAESWTEIELFGNSKYNELSQFLKLPNDIPSHDTIGRVFGLLKATDFEACFRSWTQSLFRVESDQIIAIDGKSLRRSHDKARGKVMLHMVSAFAVEQGLSLAQINPNYALEIYYTQ